MDSNYYFHRVEELFPFYIKADFYSVLVFIVQGLIRVVDDESAGFTGVPIFLCGVQVALRIFNADSDPPSKVS